jgi:hypothetical protein
MLNPVRAGLCERPEQWRWSSCRASIGLAPVPRFLSQDRLASALGTSPAGAARVLRDFVDAALAVTAQGGDSPGDSPRRRRRSRGLAVPVRAREALREEADEQRSR